MLTAFLHLEQVYEIDSCLKNGWNMSSVSDI